MKLGVMNPVLNSYTLEEALRYLHGLGVQSLEIGAGGFPGDAHLKPAELIGKPDKIKEFKDLFEKYEIDRIGDFYSTRYQQKVLKYEYNMAVKSSMIRFYVFLKDNPSKIIGTVCLHNISANFYGCCEIGYKFSSQYHHMGYAREAVIQCIHVAFSALGLNRITAMVCIGNEPSEKLLTGIGFEKEGLCREYLMLHGRWMDHYLFSLLKHDFYRRSIGQNQ